MFDAKACKKKWAAEHPEKMREYRKAWALRNREQKKEKNKEWRKNHPNEKKEWYAVNREYAKECSRKFWAEHPEKNKEQRKKWLLIHPGYQRDYFRTPKGKGIRRKADAERRQLGFIPLNKPFPEARGHHVDRERVIYVPRKMHEDNRHSVLRNQGMEKINKLAFEFLSQGRG